MDNNQSYLEYNYASMQPDNVIKHSMNNEYGASNETGQQQQQMTQIKDKQTKIHQNQLNLLHSNISLFSILSKFIIHKFKQRTNIKLEFKALVSCIKTSI